MSCYILGIHDGHNCGASLLKNGAIVGSLSEERISRVKNEVGYPRRAIDALLRQEKIAASDLSGVALASNFMHDAAHLTEVGPWYRVGLDDQRKDKLANKDYNRVIFAARRQQRLDVVKDHLGHEGDAVVFVEHHHAHATSAYFGSRAPWNEPALVFTMDGAGDGICGSVSIARNGVVERQATVDRAASVGKVYSRVTYLMGMKPWEHEFKIMGMAPYADEKYSKKSRDVFAQLMGLTDDGLNFALRTELETNYCYFWLRDHLENHRFDAIAGGVQAFTEDLLVNWVAAWVKKTGIRKVVCGGGVFMNVKANMLIAQLPEVEYLFVMPSCGDESLGIGAAYQMYRDRCPKEHTKPLETLYLGTSYGNADVEAALTRFDLSGCRVERVDNINDRVGREVAANHIVARFNGRMEWGARALGNRSILANAAHFTNIERINSMIKQRDFWMPFAPSMLEERAHEYIHNPKDVDAAFMMYAFETTKLANDHLAAGIHPRDKTARAQTVNAKRNPGYYEVLKSYEKASQRAGLLNTSFNLHGYPIVESPWDAIDVFLRSGLDMLAVENVLIGKPRD